MNTPTKLPVTCGFVLVDTHTGHWLLAHPTNKQGDIWDFPKGMASEGETHLAAAIRELREETGLVLPQAAHDEILDFGQHPFADNKDMRLFYARMPIKLDTLFCMSWVPSLTGPEFPEVDDYCLLPPAEVLKKLSGRKRKWVETHVLPHLPLEVPGLPG